MPVTAPDELEALLGADRVLGRASDISRVGAVAVHPTCATREMGLAGRLRSLAGALAASPTRS
jgi:hypothetical protein